MSLRIRWSIADETGGSIVDQTFDFSGSVSGGGRFLEGTVHQQVAVDGAPVLDLDGSIVLERD